MRPAEHLLSFPYDIWHMSQVSIKCEACGTYNDVFSENCIYCGAPLPKVEGAIEEDDEEKDD